MFAEKELFEVLDVMRDPGALGFDLLAEVSVLGL